MADRLWLHKNSTIRRRYIINCRRPIFPIQTDRYTHLLCHFIPLATAVHKVNVIDPKLVITIWFFPPVLHIPPPPAEHNPEPAPVSAYGKAAPGL